jgi:DNA invertase Pin-like site-specific DNA recombinase
MDTSTPMGSMAFTVMAARAQKKLEITQERITDSVADRRTAGKDLGGRGPTFTGFRVRNVVRLILDQRWCH